MTVGQAVENSCHGMAGVPLNVRAVVVDSTKIRYEWNKPNCDEGLAPIDGYEYIVSGLNEKGKRNQMHESGHHPSHDAASYIGGAGITMQDLLPNTRYSFRVRFALCSPLVIIPLLKNSFRQWTLPLESCYPHRDSSDGRR